MPVLGKVGLVNKGTYNASTAYTALDFVKYNGSTYVALKGVQGITPSDDGTNWSYLAQGVDVTISNSQTVTTPGTALDAVQANKNVNGSLAYNIDQQITSLSDSLATKANKSAPTLYFKIGTQDGDPQSSYPHVELRSAGNASSGRSFSLQYYTASDTSTPHYLIDKNGNFVPEIQTQIDNILGMLPFYFSFVTIGGNASKVFNSPNNTSIWILWAGGNNSANGIASMRIVDSNVTNFHSINAGAGTSTQLSAAWNTSTGKLTLSNSGGAAVRCFIFSEKQLTE